MAAVLPYVPTIARGAMSVGSTALAYAKKYVPNAAKEATAYFAKQRKDVNVLAANKSPKLQGAVITQLLRNGVQASTFAEAMELTPAERETYAGLIGRFHEEQMVKVDQDQTTKATTGDRYLDVTTTILDIKSICEFTGWSSEQYKKLIRGINTHTSNDIELFQLDRLKRGEKFI